MPAKAKEKEFDPFDPEHLRLDPSQINNQIGVERAVVVCPVRKPDRQEFVRVHPSDEFKIDLTILEDRDTREVYLVDQSFAPNLPDFTKVVRLAVAINRHDTPFLWVARLPNSERRDSGLSRCSKLKSWHRRAGFESNRRWRVVATLSTRRPATYRNRSGLRCRYATI